MQKELLDVIFASEKRKRVLLLLQDGVKEMEYLLKTLETTRQALLPQVKILEEHYLISHEKDSYKLTTIGKSIVDDMSPLLNKIGVLNSNLDYWGTNKLDFIPQHLMGTIFKLKKCRVITPPITEAHQISREFQESSRNSTSVFTITTFLHPNFVELLSELINNNATIHTIVSKDLLDSLLTQHALKFEKLLKSKLVYIYVYPEKMNLMSFAYNDYQIMMVLQKSSGEIDNNHFLCSNPESLNWAKDLFEYYLKDSIPITEI
jgi:predicted transcriptional regulator